MAFIYEPIGRIRAMTRVVSFSTRSVGKRGGSSRHALLFGAGVVEAMGWRPGMKIAAGYGAPGSSDAGWMEIKPSEIGVLLRSSGPRSLKAEVHAYPDFVTDRPHPVEHCATWQKVGDALRVKLPDWVFKPHTAERGDHPHAGKPKTGEPDNSSLAKAGGGESSEPTDAPPAEIRDTREEGREGLPPTGASSKPVSGKAPERTAARNSTSGHGAMNGNTLKGEHADHTGGEEAATVAPPVRELSDKQRAVYLELKRAAAQGAQTPRLVDLARVIGSDDPSMASYQLGALFKLGLVIRGGSQADVTYHVVEIGKSTVSRALRRAAIVKPVADTHGGVAPVNGHVQAINGPVPRGDVIAWLNNMGMTCHEISTDNYLLGEEYVGWRHVLARANRKRRMRKEPEFAVA